MFQLHRLLLHLRKSAGRSRILTIGGAPAEWLWARRWRKVICAAIKFPVSVYPDKCTQLFGSFSRTQRHFVNVKLMSAGLQVSWMRRSVPI